MDAISVVIKRSQNVPPVPFSVDSLQTLNMSTLAETAARVDDVVMNPAVLRPRVYEIHDTTGDGREWLKAMRNFLSPYVKDPTTPSIYPYNIVNDVGIGSLCKIEGCENFVECGAHIMNDNSPYMF